MADMHASKRLRTGRHQRAKANDIAAVAESRGSNLVIDSETVLQECQQWGWGVTTAADLNRTCLNAYRDQVQLLERLGLSSDEADCSLRKMAKLGDWGKVEGNIKRDLMRTLGEPLSPESMVAPIHCIAARSGKVVEVPMPFNAPHLVMSKLFATDRAAFDNLFFGGPYDANAVSTFWKTVVARKDPRILNHPMCTRPDWHKRAIPIFLHGDEVPCTGVGKTHGKSYDVHSWQSAFARGASRKVKVYVAGVFDHAKTVSSPLAPHNTLDEMWEAIMVSYLAAYEGKHPTERESHGVQLDFSCGGSDLADGFFLVIWGLKGDLDYWAKGYYLRHYASHEFCEFCPASQAPECSESMRSTNFKANAGWNSKFKFDR